MARRRVSVDHQPFEGLPRDDLINGIDVASTPEWGSHAILSPVMIISLVYGVSKLTQTSFEKRTVILLAGLLLSSIFWPIGKILGSLMR